VWRWGIAAALVLGALFVLGHYRGVRRAGVLKPIPVALLALLVVLEPAPVSPAYRTLVLAALAFSMAGDVWLLAPERFFRAGLASFLVAHLFYIAAFVAPGDTSPGGWLLAVPFLVVGAGMLTYLWPHLGGDRFPVVVYVAVLGVMGWQAARRAGLLTTPAPSGDLALAGAVVFMLSDGILAVDRFAWRFAAAEGAIMTTYYAAQTLIALSVRV
jgi:uncharacterized membrane protein YhhN